VAALVLTTEALITEIPVKMTAEQEAAARLQGQGAAVAGGVVHQDGVVDGDVVAGLEHHGGARVQRPLQVQLSEGVELLGRPPRLPGEPPQVEVRQQRLAHDDAGELRDQLHLAVAPAVEEEQQQQTELADADRLAHAGDDLLRRYLVLRRIEHIGSAHRQRP